VWDTRSRVACPYWRHDVEGIGEIALVFNTRKHIDALSINFLFLVWKAKKPKLLERRTGHQAYRLDFKSKITGK
jgi:hypothetical protein